MASGLCVPHKQAAHMAAPTEGQNIKNTLANGEPSTHGAKQPLATRAEWPLLTQSGHSFWASGRRNAPHNHVSVAAQSGSLGQVLSVIFFKHCGGLFGGLFVPH